ncbi:RluA family pseudouridine synthase [Bengtsoniella intestinalis]|uniref:RluA family pseudouridine synthase n=1 Tax=Bengtsoniella intestinalis TaxID=3073143 RepID=UPI00391F990B
MTYIVTDDQQGSTVKTVLKHTLQVSSTTLSRLRRQEGGILRNGAPVRTIDTVSTGDVLEIALGDDAPMVGETCPLPVVYEDGALLVLDKPAGMAVHHSTLNPDTPTVEQVVLDMGLPFHVVNRLDKGTTGLMVVAKSGYIHSILQQKLHSGDFQRTYLAICDGCPSPLQGQINAPIGRKDGSAIARCVRDDGAVALSDYKVLSHHDDRSLVWLSPQTGRTHQLRVHMAHLGCPLTGDWLYGTENQSLITRPALHSATLTMTHPLTGERLVLEAALPEDMDRLIAQ